MTTSDRIGQKSGLSRALKVLILCVLWYASSSASNVINKIVLNDFPFAVTVSLAQYITTLVLLVPLVRAWRLPKVSFSKHTLKWTILPLSFGKFFSLAASHFSISKVPVSFAHTIKASMPIFVLLLGRIIWKEKQPVKIYFSVIPIVIGIAMATISELNFNLIGTIAAFASTIGFALQSLYTKKSLRDLNIHPHVLLQHLTFYGLFMLLTLWIFSDLPKIMEANHENLSIRSITVLLVISGICSLLQNLAAFSVMAIVSTVSYSVASATKRVVVITVSLLTLKNPVNALNVGGMVLACFGVFLYNRVKTNLRKIPVLPTFSSPPMRTA